MTADKLYSKTSMYRRTVALIKIDDESSYVMDVFRVKGGNDHVYSFHGPEGAVDVRGLNLKKQAKGTYAGEDVPFGYAYDRKDPTISSYQGSGFHYLYDVERDENPSDTFEIIWNAKDTWNLLPPGKARNILTVLTKLHEAALASGTLPKPAVPPKTIATFWQEDAEKTWKVVFFPSWSLTSGIKSFIH